MSQQSESADLIFESLNVRPFPLARLVRELRAKWGESHRFPEVHRFVCEVGTCLLRPEDVEVGDLEEGRFVPWQIDPWDADERIEQELMRMTGFLDDDTRYIFRKKLPNQRCAADAGGEPISHVGHPSSRAADPDRRCETTKVSS
jgi:hypothetical protein